MDCYSKKRAKNLGIKVLKKIFEDTSEEAVKSLHEKIKEGLAKNLTRKI